MKADKDDRWNRQPKHSSLAHKILWAGALSVITMTLAYHYVPSMHIALDRTNGTITMSRGNGAPNTLHETPPSPQNPATYAPERPQQHSAQPINKQAPKQTVFNDSNYIPRGAINSMPPPPQIAYNQQAPRQQIRHSNRQTHSAYWEWDTGHNKKKVWGQFQWVESNGSIEWGSVCQNYRRGSIEYRDCRKGAKVALINMCGRYKPACMAENGFRP